MKSFLDKALEEQIYWIREKDGTLRQCDVVDWAAHFEDPNSRIIKKTKIKVPTAIVDIKKSPDKIVEISTVFLGMSHGKGPTGKPLLFESMIFLEGEEASSEFGGDMRRYETEADAIKGHDEMEREFREKVGTLPKKTILMGKDAVISIDGKKIEGFLESGLITFPEVSTIETEDPEQKRQREDFKQALKKL